MYADTYWSNIISNLSLKLSFVVNYSLDHIANMYTSLTRNIFLRQFFIHVKSQLPAIIILSQPFKIVRK